MKIYYLLICISQILDEHLISGSIGKDEVEEMVVYYNHKDFPDVYFFLVENQGKIRLSAARFPMSTSVDMKSSRVT